MEDQTNVESGKIKPIISTEIDILIRWLKIREENGLSMPDNIEHLKIICHKSSLLYRLLSGKEPLDIPPPKSHSYPWYELIDNGIAKPFYVWHANDEFSKSLWSYDALIIDQFPWKILKTLNENSWIVTYSYGLDNKQFSPDRWHVYKGINSHLAVSGTILNNEWEIKKI